MNPLKSRPLEIKDERMFQSLVIVINMGAFFIGTQYGVLTMSQPTINQIFQVDSPLMVSIMNSSVMLGALVGSMVAEKLLKIASRRMCLTIADFIAVFSLLLSQFIDIRLFVAYRLIAGFSVGLNCALIPAVVRDYSPAELSGKYGSQFALFIPAGIGFSYLVGLGYPEVVDVENSYWRFGFLVPLVPLLIRIYYLQKVYLLEPPVYYLETGKDAKAEEFFRTYYKNVDQSQLNEQFARIIQNIQLDQKSQESSYLDLFKTSSLKRRVIVGCMIQIIQVLSGMISIIFFSNYIFMEATKSFTLSFLLSMLFVFFLCITCVIVGNIVKTTGIKRILEVGTFFNIIFLSGLGIAALLLESASPENKGLLQTIIIFSIFGFTISFGLSIGPLTWVYNADMLPPKGIALSTLANVGCNVLISFIFPILNSALGIGPVFLIFSFNTFLGLIFIRKQMLDTHGKSKYEIEKMYGDEGEIDSTLELKQLTQNLV